MSAMNGHWECRNGHVVSDEKAKVCPECGADVMWSWGADSPAPSAEHAHNTGPQPAPLSPSPWAWVFTGLLVSGVGVALWMTGENDGLTIVGLLLILVGTTVNAVGVIAAGVRMGIESSRSGNLARTPGGVGAA